MHLILKLSKPLRALSFMSVMLVCSCLLSGVASAQSTDIALPTPVQTNEVTAKIAPRDLGDARLTDHFYAFTGTPGDVLITVDSRNMNGDVDVFTSTGLRPLLKFTVYAGTSGPVTKSIYLRKREDLLLRIEARTPNDDDATYRLRFGGSFEPITSGPLVEAMANTSTEPTLSSTGTGRRVSSVGARINEPPVEIATSPEPEPSPSETPKPEETTATAAEEPAPSVSEAPVVRGPRGRRAARRRARPTEPVVPEATAEPTSPSATPDQDPESQAGPRLIIETSDGTLINRNMSGVRRVIVENGQVVVVGRDGKIYRIALANVVKMSISPD